MTRRRFFNGWGSEISGIHFRVVQGQKSPNDLKIEWLTAFGWRPIEMDAAALLADFFYENEEALYPQTNGYKGGQKFWEFLRHAMRHGWVRAVGGKNIERSQRQLWESDVIEADF